MSTNGNVIDGLSTEQLQMILKERKDAEKLVQQAAAARYAEIGVDLLTSVVTETTREFSEASGWTGHSVRALPFTVDGEAYTASLVITHVADKTARDLVVTQAKKFASLNKLNADDTKAAIKAALDQHEAANA